MDTTVAVLMNQGSSTTPYRVKVYSVKVDFKVNAGEYKDITKEVYENVAQGTIQNTLSGVDMPAVEYKNDDITISLKGGGPNAFYMYYKQFLHSCIPSKYQSETDSYMDSGTFKNKTGVSTQVRTDKINKLGKALVQYILKSGSEDNYVQEL